MDCVEFGSGSRLVRDTLIVKVKVKTRERLDCIIGVVNNSRWGKDYPFLDQNFQGDFNKLRFTSIALKPIRIPLDSIEN